MKKIVISLCDLTGNMVKPWSKMGYECYCVDLQHSIRKERVEEIHLGGKIHFVWGDVRSWLPPNKPIAFVSAFPPCTHVAGSGARDFKLKGLVLLADSFNLFNACQLIGAYSGAPYMIENPVGVFSTHIRKPDYTFNPCDYGGYLKPEGDKYTKKTSLKDTSYDPKF
jgi:hypothetical protein